MATHVKLTIVLFVFWKQVVKCAVSALPEMDVGKEAIFFKTLHAHPTINHFIDESTKRRPRRKRRKRQIDWEMASLLFPGIIIVVVHHKWQRRRVQKRGNQIRRALFASDRS